MAHCVSVRAWSKAALTHLRHAHRVAQRLRRSGPHATIAAWTPTVSGAKRPLTRLALTSCGTKPCSSWMTTCAHNNWRPGYRFWVLDGLNPVRHRGPCAGDLTGLGAARPRRSRRWRRQRFPRRDRRPPGHPGVRGVSARARAVSSGQTSWTIATDCSCSRTPGAGGCLSSVSSRTPSGQPA